MKEDSRKSKGRIRMAISGYLVEKHGFSVDMTSDPLVPNEFLVDIVQEVVVKGLDIKLSQEPSTTQLLSTLTNFVYEHQQSAV
jgi:hypothetical protein